MHTASSRYAAIVLVLRPHPPHLLPRPTSGLLAGQAARGADVAPVGVHGRQGDAQCLRDRFVVEAMRAEPDHVDITGEISIMVKWSTMDGEGQSAILLSNDRQHLLTQSDRAESRSQAPADGRIIGQPHRSDFGGRGGSGLGRV